MPLASTPLTLSAFADRLEAGHRKALEAVQGLAREAGFPTFAVGGPVRDFLLGSPVADLDFSVEGDALLLARRLADVTGGSVTTHPRFGTATVTIGETRIDLVTARRESYPEPGQLPVVVRSTIADDLARRDFTVNAMALPLADDSGGVLDQWNGLDDLEAGVIRILHPESFVDDPTRMFRAVRYEQRFGFEIHEETGECMRQAITSGRMEAVSGDRWRHEIERILDEADPGAALLRAARVGLLSGLHPALARVDGLNRLPWCRYERFQPDEWLAAMFAHLTVAEGEAVIDRLKFSGSRAALARDTIRVREASCGINEVSQHPSGLYRLVSGFDPVAVALNAKLAADPMVSSALRFYLDELKVRETGISGNELLEMGATQGPAVGRILSQLRDARLDGQVTTIDEERALAQVLVTRIEAGAAKQSR